MSNQPADKNTATQYAADLIAQGYSTEEVKDILRKQHIATPGIKRVLSDLIDSKGFTADRLADFVGIDPATIFRILKGTRNPSRNILLRIALVLKLSIEETQALLKSGNCASLSGSRERDLVIMEGIIHKRFIDEVNYALTEKGMLDLNSRG